MTKKPTYEDLEQKVKKLDKSEFERKQSDKALKESELKHKTLVQNIPGMVYRGYTDWSAEIISGSEEICGYTNNELNSEKENWLNIIHSDDKARVFREGSELAKRKQNTVNKYRIVTKGGDIRWVEDRKRSLFSEKGEFIGIDGIVFDITERKRNVEALRDSEQRFRDLTEKTSDWVWEVGREGVYTYSSPKVIELLGYEPEELLGKTPFDFMPSEEAKRVSDIFYNFFSSQEPFDSLENTNLHKNGYPVVMETSGVPFFNAEGEFSGYRGIDRSITERKRNEEMLRKAHDELENRVEERTAALAKTNEILKHEIEERIRIERTLQKAHDELEQRVEERTEELELKKINLEELNTALKVLLQKRDQDKSELEEKVVLNIKKMVTVYLDKLKQSRLNSRQITYIEIIESNLKEIVSPFTRTLSNKYINLTPAEIEIATFIKQGKATKEVGKLLNLSPRTIEFHRDNIRQKMGLKNKKINLRSYLSSLS